MPSRNIRDRLRSGECLLLDGGTGPEHIQAMRAVVKGLKDLR